VGAPVDKHVRDVCDVVHRRWAVGEFTEQDSPWNVGANRVCMDGADGLTLL
jgi:hypothetical protein